MPPLRSFLCVLIVIILCVNLGAGERYAVGRRDGSSSASTTIPDAPTTTPSASKSESSTSESAEKSSTSEKPAVKTTSSRSSTTSSSTTTAEPAPTSINGDSASNFTSPIFNATLTPNELPIVPLITPGFSVAGVLMMLSGAVYALIGMKNKRIHIFLSATYLASLGVTVLIVYVMNPPVSNAIQGAYVVAIVMTGLILGGAALIFTEMTEGLGCLFGGFCLSMWLLVLSPGGLLKDTGSIAGFIAAFTVAAYATSFSHYTRPYGLIGSISFGGATVVVMGIDCFSRAGLKEFWAYIWNLNENLFPLGATTYPMTKGIKVEIAGIIIIFLFGVVSQSRLWNIIKERREKRAQHRLEDEAHTREEEENVGRRIEQQNQMARGEWEAVYGDKDVSGMVSEDSGVGIDSPRKGARSTVTSINQSGDEQIEMNEIPPAMTGAGLATKGPDGTVTVRVVADDEPSEHGKRLSRASNQNEGEGIWTVAADGEARPASRASSRRNSKRASKRNSAGPDITPLPFTVPEGEGEADGDCSSVATFATEDNDKRMSKRLSQGSMLLRKLSKRSQMNPSRLSHVSVSTEKLVIPHDVEDDRSSIAATMDELTDDEDERRMSGLSLPGSRLDMRHDLESVKAAEEQAVSENLATPKSSTLSTDPKTIHSEDAEALEAQPNTDTPPSEFIKSAPKPALLTKAALPPTQSKVVTSYRTNEWAKHLSTAEAPEHEELKLPTYETSPITTTDEAHLPLEHAAPLDVVELQKTAANAQVAPAPIRSVSQTSTHPVISRASSSNSLRPNSHQQMNPLRSYRNSSAPAIGATLVESPVEEDISQFPSSSSPNYEPGNNSNAISRMSSTTSLSVPSFAQTAPTTLLGMRDTMLRSKTSSTFTPLAPTPEVVRAPSSASNSGSYSAVRNPQLDPRLDDDNLSLSARKSIMRQSSASRPGTALGNGGGGNGSSPYLPQPIAFDSHQPQRTSILPPAAARESQLAAWRASVQADLRESTRVGTPTGNGMTGAYGASYGAGGIYSNGNVNQNIERQHSLLYEERKKKEWSRELEERGKLAREREWGERMRSGGMAEAHREALRKMQRVASENAAGEGATRKV